MLIGILLIIGCSNVSHLSIVSTKDYNHSFKYKSIGQIEAKSSGLIFYYYTLFMPNYKNTTIEYVIKKAIRDSDADYITNVKVYESEKLYILFG